MSSFGVHDLLRIDGAIATGWNDAPTWVALALARAPWVVVRRDRLRGRVAVGVRGRDRAQRFAAVLHARDVIEMRTPEQLVSRVGEGGRLSRAFLATALAAQERGLAAAPIGAFGFQVASGVLATHRASDLDVRVRPAGNLSRDALVAFGEACARIERETATTLDVEVELGDAAFALAELLRGGSVIAKTANGPCSFACPI